MVEDHDTTTNDTPGPTPHGARLTFNDRTDTRYAIDKRHRPYTTGTSVLMAGTDDLEQARAFVLSLSLTDETCYVIYDRELQKDVMVVGPMSPLPPAPDPDAATFDAICERLNIAVNKEESSEKVDLIAAGLGWWVLAHAATIRAALAPERPLAVGDTCVVVRGYAEWKHNQWPHVDNPVHDGDEVTIDNPSTIPEWWVVLTASDWAYPIPARFLRRVASGSERAE